MNKNLFYIPLPLNSLNLKDFILKFYGSSLLIINFSIVFRGFSYVDLIEDARSHKTFALKRIKCHSKEDENIAMQEVEIMRLFKHQNLVPLEEFVLVPVGRYAKNTDICSEMHIVMPYYSVSSFTYIPLHPKILLLYQQQWSLLLYC